MKNILQLFWSFFKIGLFTFGGGLAMIPIIENEAVKKHGWITEQDMINMIVIAESTPGVIAVNSATFVGYKVGKFVGSLVATIGVVLPSLILLTALSFVLEDFLTNEVVKCAFMGIRACVAALVVNAALKLFKKCPKSLFVVGILLATVVVRIAFSDVSTIIILIAGFLVGIIYNLIINAHKGKKEVNGNA